MQSEVHDILLFMRSQQDTYSNMPIRVLADILRPKYDVFISACRGRGFMARVDGLWKKWFANPLRALSTSAPAPAVEVSLHDLFEKSVAQTKKSLKDDFFETKLKAALYKLISNVVTEARQPIPAQPSHATLIPSHPTPFYTPPHPATPTPGENLVLWALGA